MLRAIALTTLSVLAGAMVPTAHASTPPLGPAGDAFYNPPAGMIPGPEGSIIWARPADGLAEVPGAARTTLVLYRSRGATGAPVAISGTVVVPPGPAPAGGWPIAAWGHVTTGAGDDCAPSKVTADHPEQRRLLGDVEITPWLISLGIAVVRTDYEGIGTPGPHPYLIGASLARSNVNMVRAGRALEGDLARRWVAIGHSEGGAAAIFTAQDGPAIAPELDLRAAAALAPPVATRETLELGRQITSAIPGLGSVTAIGGLVLGGGAAAHPDVSALYRSGGLSPRANDLLADLETRCLTALGATDSWGSIAPAAVPGPLADELERVLYPILDANSPANANTGNIPVRIDAGELDLVTPAFTITAAVRQLRERGMDITYRRHLLSSHPSIVTDLLPVLGVTHWVWDRLR